MSATSVDAIAEAQRWPDLYSRFTVPAAARRCALNITFYSRPYYFTVDLYWRHEDEGTMTEIADTFDSAFTKAVDLGNRLADKDKDADLWDIADGLLAGALQYWLYSRQPCGDPRCQDCMPISTAEGRMAELKRLMEQLAAESEYFHTPTDANAGRA
jgi:hypothetical protein